MHMPREWHSVHVELRPLGDYEQLLASASRPWGAGTIVHGSGVLDDLVAGIERHRDTDWTSEYWQRLIPRPVAVGCVPWLTDRPVAEALASLDQCCVVVDKQQPEYDPVRWLALHGTALSTERLRSSYATDVTSPRTRLWSGPRPNVAGL